MHTRIIAAMVSVPFMNSVPIFQFLGVLQPTAYNCSLLLGFALGCWGLPCCISFLLLLKWLPTKFRQSPQTALFSDTSRKYGSSHLATNLGAPMGFPRGLVGKESGCQCRKHKRCSFHLWVRKILYEKEMATHWSILAWEIPWPDWHGNPSSSLRSQKMEFTNTQTLMVASR